MQSDRPLASYRCGLYANSFLRDDQERNHARLWEVDLVDGFPDLLDNRPLLERRRPKARFKQRGSEPRENRSRPAPRSRRKISRRAMGEEGGASFNLASPARALAHQRSNRSGGWTQTTTSGIALLLGLLRCVGARAFTAWWGELARGKMG
jgi:hypothetical protein